LSITLISLHLKYKGSRTYLHGSDIFNALVDMFSKTSNGYLSRQVFKSFARNQIEVLLYQPEHDVSALGNGVWKMTDGVEQRFWLREGREPVAESYPFDEDAITSKAIQIEESIRLEAQNAYSTIENVIALTKYLSYALTPDVDGKWLFGQIDLKQTLPERWESIQIERKLCVANAFSRNRIEIDGQDIGEIRFIGGQP